MNKKIKYFFFFLLCFFLLANKAEAACSGSFQASSCDDGGNSLSSSANRWPRDVVLSDGAFFSCSGNGCVATNCSPLVSVQSDFSAIDFSSSAVGPADTILSWTCTGTDCNCNGCWCSGYTPNYGSPSCGTSAQVASFNDSDSKPIYNLPVSVTGGDWNYCGPGSPSIIDPINPLPDGGRNRISACAWSDRPADSCPSSSIQEHEYNITDQEKTFTCNATDMDGIYDNLTYRFWLEELGVGGKVECPSAAWIESSGGWCRQVTNGGNQVTFRSSDPLAQYQMTCEVKDNVGSTDYSYNLIKVGNHLDPVSCALYPERIAVCAGESTKVRVDTHPDDATVTWTCNNANAQSGNVNGDFILAFTNNDFGSKTISMTVTSAGQSNTCASSVNVLGSSCDVNLEPLGGTDLGALVPGSQVEIVADPSCFVVASGNAYEFNLTKDGDAAIKGTDYTDEVNATGSHQSEKSVTIKIINPGQYGVSLTINKEGGGTVSCNNEFLANTSATEWWERRP